MKKLLPLLAIALIVGLAGSCLKKSHKTYYDDDENTEVNAPVQDNRHLEDAINPMKRDSLEAVERSKDTEENIAKQAEENLPSAVKVDDSEFRKIAKDVDDYCEGIQSCIDNEIPCASSTAYRFQNSPLSSRIAKYKR